MQTNKTFSARANETFRGLHPRAILGIKKRLKKRPVRQQFISATPSLYIIYMALLARKMKSSCIIAHYIVNDKFQRRNWFNLKIKFCVAK